MIIIKSAFDIVQIKKAVNIWKDVRTAMYESAKIGVTLKELDQIANNIIRKSGAIPTFYNYQGYKANICTSVNEVIIHGVPDNYKLKDQDLLSIDVGVTYNNYVCDAAYTIVIGTNHEAEVISKVCYDSLLAGIKAAIPGNTTGDISHSIEKHIISHGYEILKDFTGHGCGKKMHEDPLIPNIGIPKTGVKLVEGMVLCLEPMIMIENDQYIISKKDSWSVIAKNKKLTCHWEHMILITKDGCEVLTE